MKAAELTGIGRFHVVDKPRPRIEKDTEVCIAVHRAGICGSDMQYYTSGGIGNARISYPFTVGHECAGIIAEVGEKVSRVKPGDRVAVDPTVSCGECDQCLDGRVHTCRNIQFLGSPGELSGCMAEYIIMPETCCYPIPDSMSLEQALIAEPLAIGIYSVKSALESGSGASGVLGAGPIGLSVLTAAKAAGTGRVYVTEKLSHRLEAAAAAGADGCFNPDRQNVVSAVTEQEKEQLDVVYECCGEQEALDQGIELLKPGGKLLIVGIPKTNRVSFPIHQLRRKEITIINVRRQNDCTQEALDLITSGKGKVDFMSTHLFPLSDVEKGFQLVSEYGDGVIKAMVSMHEGDAP